MTPIKDKFLRAIRVVLLIAAVFLPVRTTYAQLDIAAQIEQFESGTTAERIANVRTLSMLVLRNLATETERKQIIKFLTSAVNDDDAVVRLNVHLELLKIGASNKDDDMVNLAMSAVEDKNINVRRGVLKYYASFFAGRMDAGIHQKDLLVGKLDDPDLETRFQVARTLLSWGIVNEKVLNIMFDCLEMSNYRASITYALTTLPNRKVVVAKALKRLQESDHNAGILIRLISQMGDEANFAIVDMLDMFGSKDVTVRAAIVEAIGRAKLNGPKVESILKGAVVDPAPEVRQLALPSIFTMSTNDEFLVSAVSKLLGDSSQGVRETAAGYLSVRPDLFPKYLPRIRELLASDDKAQIYSVVNGVVTAGQMAAPLIDDVAKLLKADSTDIRSAGCWCLLEISPEKNMAIAAFNREIAETKEDDMALLSLIGALAEAKPNDGESKRTFLKLLEHPNSNVRYACVVGLTNYDASDFAETMLLLPGTQAIRTAENYSALDRMIVESVAKLDVATELAKKYMSDDNDTHIRARAIRILAAAEADDEQVKQLVEKLLDDKVSAIRFAAAGSLKNFPVVEQESFDKIFKMMDPNRRQVTVGYINMIKEMGQKAHSTVGRLAEYLSGKFRNRFANDAKNAILTLAPFVEKPVPELGAGQLTVQKLDCIAAVAKIDKATEEKLTSFIEESAKAGASTRNLNLSRSHRRNELIASVALANGLGDNTNVNPKLLEELETGSEDLAYLVIGKLKKVDKEIVNALITKLPSRNSINTLAAIGPQAKSAVDELMKLYISKEPNVSALAKRAVWQIEEDVELAISAAREILDNNRLQPTDIRVADRQSLWEVLRYLYQEHGENPEVVELMKSVQQGRFPNLRSFVRNLGETL